MKNNNGNANVGKTMYQQAAAQTDVKGSIGDMSMFLHDEAMAKSSGLVNGLYPVGKPMDLEDQGLNHAPWGETTCEPGIMYVTWMPTPGVTTSASDPINASGSKRFARMRQKNFSTNYMDIPDLTFHFLATDSIFILHNILGLLYKHILPVNQFSLYQPKWLVQALGFDYSDMVKHLAELLTLIKKVQAKIEVMKLPKSLGYTQRHIAMTSRIYKDGPTEKAQLFVFAPKYLWKYDINGPKLTAVDFRPSTPMTFNDLESKVNEMLNPLLPDEEMQRINADILNYITTDVYTLKDINWDDMQVPVYDPEAVKQLHNADFVPFSAATGLDITQTVTSSYDSIIIWNPTFTTKEIGVLCKKVVDSDTLQPDFKDIMRDTRFKVTTKLVGSLPTSRGADFTFKLTSCGTELLLNVGMLVFDNKRRTSGSTIDPEVMDLKCTSFINLDMVSAGTGDYVYRFHFDGLTYGYPDNRMVGPDWVSLHMLSKFKGAPIRYLTLQYTQDSTHFYNYYCGTQGEIENLIELSTQQVIAEHETALLSAFDVN